MQGKLKRESMTQQVRKLLVDRIMSGELAPGSRITELQIAAELETSHAPVREAFRELEALGLIVTEPYKGSHVREVTKTDIRDAYIVRAELEGLAGRLAAPHLKDGTKQLEELASEVQDAAKRKHITDYVRQDVAFHRFIVEAAQNTVLLRSWDALGFEVRMHVRLATWSLDLVKAQKEHWPIIEALASGDGERAGELLRNHVRGFIS